MNNNLLLELEKIIRRKQFWYLYYRYLGDWLNAISLILSISIPFLLLFAQSADVLTKKILDQVAIFVSLAALTLTVLNNVFKFKPGSFFHQSCLIEWEDLKRKFESNLINEAELIKEIKRISERNISEESP